MPMFAGCLGTVRGGGCILVHKCPMGFHQSCLRPWQAGTKGQHSVAKLCLSPAAFGCRFSGMNLVASYCHNLPRAHVPCDTAEVVIKNRSWLHDSVTVLKVQASLAHDSWKSQKTWNSLCNVRRNVMKLQPFSQRTPRADHDLSRFIDATQL